MRSKEQSLEFPMLHSVKQKLYIRLNTMKCGAQVGLKSARQRSKVRKERYVVGTFSDQV